jgi:hypothetical protein
MNIALTKLQSARPSKKPWSGWSLMGFVLSYPFDGTESLSLYTLQTTGSQPTVLGKDVESSP